MEKRVVFKNRWLPYLLLTPQITITLVFFIWPASQALMQSVLIQDPFGLRVEFVWFENFIELFSDPHYLGSLKTTLIFSSSTAFLALSLGLLLAVMADRVVKGATVYKAALLWPYAVAPAVAGVLWLFLFSPANGILALALKSLGYNWNHILKGGQAMVLVVIAAAWKQIAYNFLFFLAGLQMIPKSLIEAASIDGARPARRNIRHHPCRHPGWSVSGDEYPGLQSLCRRLHRIGSGRLGGAIGGVDGNRRQPDRHTVPLS